MEKDDELENIIQILIWTTEEDFKSVSTEVSLLIEKVRRLAGYLEKLDRLMKIKYALKSKEEYMSRDNLLQKILSSLEKGISVLLFAPPGFQKSEILKEVYKEIGEKNATFADSPGRLSDKKGILLVDNAQDFFPELEEFIKRSKRPPVVLLATNYHPPSSLRNALGDRLKVFDKLDLQCRENLLNIISDVIFMPEDRLCWPAIKRLIEQSNRESKKGLSTGMFDVVDEFIEKRILPHAGRRLGQKLAEDGLCILSLLNGYGFPYKDGGFREEWVLECMGDEGKRLLSELKNLAFLDEKPPETYSIPIEIRLYFRDRRITVKHYGTVVKALEALGEPATILVHDFMGEWEKAIDAMNRFIHPLALYFGPFNRFSHQRKLIRGILGYQITENGREEIPGFKSINYLLNVDHLEHPYDFYIDKLTYEQRLLYAKLLYPRISFGDEDAERCFKLLFEGWKDRAIKKTGLSKPLKYHYDLMEVFNLMLRERFSDALEKIENLLEKKPYAPIEEAALHLLKLEVLLNLKKREEFKKSVVTLFEKIDWAEAYLSTDILMIEFICGKKRKAKAEKEPFFERYMVEFVSAIESGRIIPEKDALNFTLPPETDAIQDDFYIKNYSGVLYMMKNEEDEYVKGMVVYPDGKAVELTGMETKIIHKYVKRAGSFTKEEKWKKALKRLKDKLEAHHISMEYGSEYSGYKIKSIFPDIIKAVNGKEKDG